jgi:hypothetical protein
VNKTVVMADEALLSEHVVNWLSHREPWFYLVRVRPRLRSKEGCLNFDLVVIF